MADTYPWSWYSDPAVLAAERERIFRAAWHYVGHTGRLPEPSSYFACTTGGLPVVVTAVAADLVFFVAQLPSVSGIACNCGSRVGGCAQSDTAGRS